MIYIKNLIYWFVLVSTMPLMFVCAVIAAPFPKGVNRVGKAWTALLLWTLKHVVGLRYTVRGAENIPKNPCIICCKHQSGWETLALQQIFPWQTYVAKKELFRIPFFGWALKLGGTIGILLGCGVGIAGVAALLNTNSGSFLTILQVPWLTLILVLGSILLAATAVGILASLRPAESASRIPPIHALAQD